MQEPNLSSRASEGHILDGAFLKFITSHVSSRVAKVKCVRLNSSGHADIFAFWPSMGTLGTDTELPLLCVLWQASARLSPAVINRLAKELRELQLKPEESIKVVEPPVQSDCSGMLTFQLS